MSILNLRGATRSASPVSVVVLTLASLTLTGTNATDTVRIGFDQTLPDSKITALLAQYPNVNVHAARMWAAGLSGGYRTRRDLSVSEFLGNARGNASDFFGEGLKSRYLRFESFIEKYGASQVEAEPKLASEAHHHLTTASRLTRALDAATPPGEEPIIYALEVSGSTSALEQLVQHDLVQTHQFENVISVVSSDQPFLEPSRYREREVTDSTVKGLSGAQAYEQMKEAVSRGRIETDGGG